MSALSLIIAALLLDALLGDPPGWPHPVRALGVLIRGAERWCRLLGNGVGAGGLCVLLVLGISGGVVVMAQRGAAWLHPLAAAAVALYLLYTSFALRDLLVHSRRVYTALQAGNLPLARKQVAMMVGRETGRLDEAGVIRACVESVAENVVDGVTAPLCYALIGGPLGAVLYKAVNTMDSMLGYRTARYLCFGRVAARLDDVMNYLPARFTGVAMVLAAPFAGGDGRGAWRILQRDRLAHASPNSGHAEAAMAGALGLQLGGPSCYFGRMVDKPVIGEGRCRPVAADIVRANRLAVGVTLLQVVVFCPLAALWGLPVGDYLHR